MWERGNRHNPLSYRYRYYFDHRPILPQDPSLTWTGMRKSFDPLEIIYMNFIHANVNKTMLLTNLPATDRESLKQFMNYYEHFFKNIKHFSLFPTVFMTGALFKCWTPKYKILYPLTFLGLMVLNQSVISGYFKSFANNYISYMYHKYSHLAHEDINEIDDPRRKFFRLDTQSYYRQSHSEIQHKAHEHHDHNEPYYGPMPVI